MSKGTWVLLVGLLLIAFTQSRLIDEYWRKTYVQNTMTMTNGNLTLWKALHCCADNATVRPSNETRLWTYMNDTWCKGNTTCLSYLPKGDVSFAYYSQTKNRDGGDLPGTDPYFWIWILKASYNEQWPRYFWCMQDYFPRFDWWYLCQAFQPAVSNGWFYGIRWYCGSTNPYIGCINQYLMPVAKIPLFNMTGLPVGAGKFYIPCCYSLSRIVTVYVY